MGPKEDEQKALMCSELEVFGNYTVTFMESCFFLMLIPNYTNKGKTIQQLKKELTNTK